MVRTAKSAPYLGNVGLGHSQSSTTMRYAHLMDSPLRAGVDAVADMMRIRPRLVHSAPSAEEVTPPRSASARSG